MDTTRILIHIPLRDVRLIEKGHMRGAGKPSKEAYSWYDE